MSEQETNGTTPPAEEPEVAATAPAESAEPAEAVAVEPAAADTTETATPPETGEAEVAAEAQTSEPVETQPQPAEDPGTGDGPFRATGRRKTAVARVFLKRGSGQLRVNGREFAEFFTSEIWTRWAVSPLKVLGVAEQFDAKITVHGGGSSGQAGAIRMGLARALALANPSLHVDLRKGGFLTRDSRRRERKKYGQKGARRRFQWTKR